MASLAFEVLALRVGDLDDTPSEASHCAEDFSVRTEIRHHTLLSILQRSSYVESRQADVASALA